MPKTIYKYQLNPNGTKIKLPIDAEILRAKTQKNNPCLWVLLDPNEPTNVTREFVIFGTGHTIPDENTHNYLYVDTFMMYDDSLVFHCFERVDKGAEVFKCKEQ